MEFVPSPINTDCKNKGSGAVLRFEREGLREQNFIMNNPDGSKTILDDYSARTGFTYEDNCFIWVPENNRIGYVFFLSYKMGRYREEFGDFSKFGIKEYPSVYGFQIPLGAIKAEGHIYLSNLNLKSHCCDTDLSIVIENLYKNERRETIADCYLSPIHKIPRTMSQQLLEDTKALFSVDWELDRQRPPDKLVPATGLGWMRLPNGSLKIWEQADEIGRMVTFAQYGCPLNAPSPPLLDSMQNWSHEKRDLLEALGKIEDALKLVPYSPKVRDVMGM
jgi:hypothetical protein